MDTHILVPIFAALAVIAIGFVWRREPAAKGPPPKAQPKASANDKDTAKGKAKATSQARAKDTVKPASKQRAAKPGAEPAVPSLVEPHEHDLDITVIKTVVLGDLVGAAAADNASKGTTIEIGGDDDNGLPSPAKPSRVELIYEDEAEAEEVTSPVARILICAAGDSDRGQRRMKNEDSLLVLPERSLFAVADGMGGYHGGEVASTLAIDTVRHAFESGTFEGRVESEKPMPRRARELACAVQMGNQAIRAIAETDPELAQMGTTLVAARFSPNKQRVYIGHVGDSRCYRLRGETLRQLTTDHTLSTLGVKGAHANELYQALGVKANIAIDLIIDKPHDNDVYLLCSDGLSKMVKDDEVRDVLVAEPDLEAAVYGLIELANDRGGKDNITLILVKVLSRVPPDLSRLSKHNATA